MKTRNILIIALMLVLAVVASCKKDHDIPTGKVFNDEMGGNVPVDTASVLPSDTIDVVPTDTIEDDTIRYRIIVSASPTIGGSVSGGGIYDQGQSITVTATPASSYVFINWTENETEVSTQANYTFTVDGDRNLVANFTIQLQPGTGSGTKEDPYNVAAGISQQNNESVVWVQGYIVGAVKSGTTAVFSNSDINWNAPFDLATNVVIADDANCHEIGQCIIVNLPTGKPLRAQVNLVDNPGNLGKTLAVLGKLRSYFGQAGLRDSEGTEDDFVLETSEQPQAPTGAINGKFTINANGDKVYFSQGNLQYRASTNTWQFAANQYDYIGSDNSNISQTYSGWIDLFGWGTSGYHNASDPYNVNYQPWSTSTSTVNETCNYYGYGPSTNMPSPNLTGSSANYDWGVCNPISNGGGQAGQWRTLTREEWVWVLGPTNSPSPGVSCRTSSTVNGTPNARYAKGQVAGVHGVIVFPDSYTHPSGVAQPVGINETGNTGWIGNDYSSMDFGRMEANGAVFLPAAGYRFGTTVIDVGSSGYYWSASYVSSNGARLVSVGDADLYSDGSSSRGLGQSVRLACPAEN